MNERLRSISNILLLDEQAGVRKGRFCIDNVLSLKILIEERGEFNLETHVAFTDHEVAFATCSIC